MTNVRFETIPLTDEQKAKLLKLADTIERNGDHFAMWIWYDSTIQGDSGDLRIGAKYGWDLESCGTTACIAGWACALFHKQEMNPDSGEIADELGVVHSIFYEDSWPKEIRELDATEAVQAATFLRDIVNGRFPDYLREEWVETEDDETEEVDER